MWIAPTPLDAEVRTSQSDPLEVDIFPEGSFDLGKGRLGLTMLPGRAGLGSDGSVWARSIAADVAALKALGTGTLVSLVEPEEFDRTDTQGLLPTVAAAGIATVWYPIPDHGVPQTLPTFDGLLRDILRRLRQEGQLVVVHCKAGRGRTGLVVACMLVVQGHTAADAIAAVHALREDTLTRDSQQDFVRAYERRLYPDRNVCGVEMTRP
jgi:ADP-ribosyl-[dinitrogen reductase] hydrolase